MVELVHSPDVHSAGVLVDDEVVELGALLVGQAPLVHELGHYVQATACKKVSISTINGIVDPKTMTRRKERN